jgi:rfaE bifunctional protein kinase chain/domain
MSSLTEKIISVNSINLKSFSKLDKDDVIGFGHFNVIHPGHVRYLQHAKSIGKKLSIALLGESLIEDPQKKEYFSETDRAIGLASLQIVDKVFILNDISLAGFIKQLQPMTFVLGKEYQKTKRVDIVNAVQSLEQYGGNPVYHAGEIHYANADLLHGSSQSIEEERKTLFQQTCKRQNIKIKELVHQIHKFKDLRLLVIGDTIVDQYVACDAIGMSAEAPVLVVKELESREFVGGAGVVSAHINALGAKCKFLSVVGKDENAKLVKTNLETQGIEVHLVEDSSRPTTFKIRYMVENQKLFRVSRMKEHSISEAIEEELISKVKVLSDSLDGIVVCDFVYGLITPRVLQIIQSISQNKNIKLFGDLQCSSQVGNISKFIDFHLLCPTEREARIALSNQEDGLEWIANTLLNKTNADHLIVKLGPDGFVTYSQKYHKDRYKEHFPALVSNPVDVAGAGDSLLAAMATSLCSGANIMEASAVGACMAALAVQRVGNIPVTQDQLVNYLNKLEFV